jgi:hypothetical protein
VRTVSQIMSHYFARMRWIFSLIKLFFRFVKGNHVKVESKGGAPVEYVIYTFSCFMLPT